MKEVYGYLWKYPADYRCITTNGTVKLNGECVTGRGCAQEATRKYPDFPRELGQRIKKYGNEVHLFEQWKLISFPVKHQWWQIADLELIAKSVRQLKLTAELMPGVVFLLPRPGCGNGKLSYDDVRPLLLSLPDNVLVITYGE